ncbi:MAG: hypothetical protein AVDCRST_MAG51-1485, partial [uncultured Ramlibacter sp.]
RSGRDAPAAAFFRDPATVDADEPAAAGPGGGRM